MKNLVVLTISLFPAFGLAVEYPTLKDPAHAAMLERYKVDRPKIEAAGFFNPPVATASSDCSMSEVDLYQLSGLDAAHPDLMGKKVDRNGRRFFRAVGQPGTKMSWSNIHFVVVDMPCQNGAPNGLVKVFASFDMTVDSTTTSTIGTKTSTMTMHSPSHTDRWVYRTVTNGAIQDDGAIYSLMLTSTETHYSDPDTEKMMQKMAKSTGTDQPSRMLSSFYLSGNGATLRSAQFSIMKMMDVASIASGKTKYNDVLSTTVISGVDEVRSVSQMYFDAALQLVSHVKDGALHGEWLTYMENSFKKMGMDWRTQAGMEDAREVTIDGRDLLETRSCYQDGLPAKMSPCSSE